jgi:hypothetical protein
MDATIDKIVIKVGSYKVLPNNLLTTATTIKPDGYVSSRQYMNSPGYSVEVKKDKAGYPSVFIQYNPNKALGGIVEQSDKAGLIVDLESSQILRFDLAKDKQLRHGITAYHPIIKAASTGRSIIGTTAGTIHTGNRQGQICFYDKSVEAKLSTSGICRLECRWFRPQAVRKDGITNLSSLYEADLNTLYNRMGTRYLPKLNNLESDGEVIGQGAALLNHFYRTSSRPLTTFLSTSGIMGIGGIEAVLAVIKAANLPKDKAYKARQQVYKLAEQIGMTDGQNESLIAEIQSYFAA